MIESKKYTLEIGGQTVELETGKYAKSASSSVTVKQGDTVLLVTATVSEEPRAGIDFFPLLIDFEERLSSIGRIPGGFLKREGRPSDRAVLTSRLIDRPIRPLFPKGYKNDIQIVASTLSGDQQCQHDVLAVFGASAALTLAKEAPFEGPIGAVRVSKINDEFIVNPTYQQADKSDLDIVIAGTADSVIMVEAGCKFVPESVILEAVKIAQVEIKKQVEAQLEFAKQCDIEKEAFVNPNDTSEIAALIEENVSDIISKAYHNFDREERKTLLKEAKEIVSNKIEELPEDSSIKELIESSELDFVGEEFKALEKKIMRKMITEEGVRADGRKPEEVRPIWCEVGVLPRTHGSAVFTRGQTQALSVCTLAGPGLAQELDGVDPQTKKRYMHNYSFPAFSVGEVRPLRGPGRREIGHGNLAERAILPSLPPEEKFTYTMRVTSDILESNGSTSMASTCGSSLALMDAGVPVNSVISGVAMGLIQEGDKAVVLTDIQGIEDFLGDMDFKVTGNTEGITALQMDMKIKGIAFETVEKALEQAKTGRLHIMDKMKEAIDAPREEMSEHAPRIQTLQIDQKDIGAVIGPGGKNIRSIIDASGAEIDIDDSGTVSITSNDGEGAKIALDMINQLTFKFEPGQVLQGKVVRIIPIGAFVEVAPGKDGMVHISQICQERVEKVEDKLEVGQEVIVKVAKIDDKGRVNLSMKIVTDEDRAQFAAE